MNDTRHALDRIAWEEKETAQIGPTNGSKGMAQRPTFRHSDKERPDFTGRVRWLLRAFTKLDKFPDELPVDQQAKIIYERISAALWGPGQRRRANGEMVNVQRTLEEVLAYNMRSTDDLHGELTNKVRIALGGDSQLRFMTAEQAAQRDAEIRARLYEIETGIEQF